MFFNNLISFGHNLIVCLFVCLFLYTSVFYINFFFFFVFFFCLFAISWVAPVAYGGSQARGPIGAVAADLPLSHSNAVSEPSLQPTPQLMATPDPKPTEKGQGSNPRPHGSYSDSLNTAPRWELQNLCFVSNTLWNNGGWAQERRSTACVLCSVSSIHV